MYVCASAVLVWECEIRVAAERQPGSKRDKHLYDYHMGSFGPMVVWLTFYESIGAWLTFCGYFHVVCVCARSVSRARTLVCMHVYVCVCM